MRKYFVLIAIPLLLLACKKEQTIHITATNAVTGAPYPGLHYTVTRQITGMFEEKSKTVASGTLNENGEVYITKRLNKNASYHIGIEDPGNICYSNQTSFTFADGDNFEANFEFAECAYLKLNVHNINCQGAGDSMRFRSKYSYTDWEGWSSYRLGCYSYDDMGGEYKFLWD